MKRAEAATLPRIRVAEPADVAWMADAACKGLDRGGSIFFPQHPGEFADAKAICARCPVQQECLDYALARPEVDGVWGGYGSGERATMLRRARRNPGRATRSASRTPAQGTSG